MYCMYAYISYIIYLASTSSASAGFFASSLLVISFTKSDCTSARRDWKLERSSLRTYIIHIEIYLIPIVNMRKPKLSSLLVNLESHFHTYIDALHTYSRRTYTRHSTGPHATTLAFRTSLVMSARSPKNSCAVNLTSSSSLHTYMFIQTDTVDLHAFSDYHFKKCALAKKKQAYPTSHINAFTHTHALLFSYLFGGVVLVHFTSPSLMM